MSELKPCPFCGHVPELLDSSLGWYVYCPYCSAQQEGCKDKQSVVDNWNLREVEDES